MEESESSVLRTDREQCAILTLNRPRALNAISNEMVDALEKHLDEIERDASRVLIVTGSGRAFCAGTDLSAHSDNTVARMKRMHRMVMRLQNFPKISVAALNGITYGGGLEIALGCTFRIAAPTARAALPEIKLGLIPLYGGTALLPELIGRNRALEMMLGGEPIDAQEAQKLGLVNALSTNNETLLEEACAFAMRFGRHSAVPREVLRALSRRHGQHASLAEALEEEVKLAAPVIACEDAREGVAAFLEKRRPVFRDR